MFRNLLKPDSGLMITMTQITDCIFLSLFFFLGCVPVFTIGASITALYDAVYHGFRQGDKHCWQRFFRTFRENFKGSLIPSLLLLGVLCLGFGGIIRLWNGCAAGTLSWAVFAGGAFLAVLTLGILSVMFPMLSRFENPTAVLLKNTLFLSLANLPRTLVLGILNAGTFLLCLLYVLPLFFLPALASLISTLLLEPMFRPYMPEEVPLSE